MKALIERISRKFEEFASDLREVADDLPRGGAAGYGEEDDPDEQYVPEAAPAKAQAPNGIDFVDDSAITMKSGDLRKVVDSYRRLVRYAREGRIPAQDERFKLHQAVRAVKHLIRKPRHRE